jgi:hypothetical protein
MFARNRFLNITNTTKAPLPFEEAALFPLLLAMKLSSEPTLAGAALFPFAEATLFPLAENEAGQSEKWRETETTYGEIWWENVSEKTGGKMEKKSVAATSVDRTTRDL